METIDEFKTQRDQQGDAQQQERRPGRDQRSSRRDILRNAVGGEEKAARENGEKDQQRLDIKGMIKFGSFDALGVARHFLYIRYCSHL